MQPYGSYKKARKMFETFRLIKNGEATTGTELSNILETPKDNIQNYIKELNEDWGAEIGFDNRLKQYVIKHEGVLGMMKVNQPITADDIILILSSLVQSQTFMETKMEIIKMGLLSILPEEEAVKLKSLLHFQKTQDGNQQIIEFNVTKLRKAIAEEKKVTFPYKTATSEHKNYKIIPYSFACEFGKYYIICKEEDKSSLSHLRIDRMGNVRILEEEGKRADKFNVHDYLKKTWYMYGGEETKVVVRFKQQCKPVVTEKSMSVGRIIEENDEYFKYEFICNGTFGIKLWLMGFGDEAEILEPAKLREEIRDTVNRMVELYSK